MSLGNFKIHNGIPTPLFEKGLKDVALDKLQVVNFVADIPNSSGAGAVRNVYRLVPGQIVVNAFATVTDDITLAAAGTVNVSVSNTNTTAGSNLLVSGSAASFAVGANLGTFVPRLCNEFVNVLTTTAVTSTGGGKVMITLFVVNP